MFFGGGGGGRGGFPFGGGDDDDEDFGGFPFGGQRGGGKKKEVDNSRLYEVIGVAKDADAAAIKKAYRMKAMKEHPDKGGDPEKFKDLSAAYDVLSDPKKRDRYDKIGEDALKQDGQGGGGNPFEAFFGGMGGGGGQKPQARVKPIVEQIEVSLEEIYNGKEFTIAVERQGLCEECEGVGGTDPSAVRECGTCDGRGVVMAMQMLGPGMYTQTRRACSDCEGEGKLMDKSKVCKKCKGKKVAKQTKQHKVQLEKGMTHGEKIELKGHGHQVPDLGDGDLIVVVGVKKHKTFRRKGADLFMVKAISLCEALTGVDCMITHLDGRNIRLTTEAGFIVDHDMQLTADGLGMPFYKKNFMHGNLFITFDVKFPKNLTELQMVNVATALSDQQVQKSQTAGGSKKGKKNKGGGQKQDQSEDETIETVKLEKMTASHQNTHVEGGKQGKDSDDDEDDEEGHQHGPGGIPCQQQ